jgi:hypothetical protein
MEVTRMHTHARRLPFILVALIVKIKVIRVER